MSLVYIINVGANTSHTGKARSPIFGDGSWVYVSFPTRHPYRPGYSLDARVAYSGQLECSRCLAAYPFQEGEAFTLLLYPSSRRPTEEVELSAGDLDVLYYDDPVVPLSPIAEERVQMALPMKPLCRPDCRGLCPDCGKDLNSLNGPCGCVRDTVDPRWDALKALREKA